MSRLIGEKRRLENRLGGFFDEEINIQINALNSEIEQVRRDVNIEYKQRKILQDDVKKLLEDSK